jgi:hypothetical protein
MNILNKIKQLQPKQKVFLSGASVLLTYGISSSLLPSMPTVAQVVNQVNTHANNLIVVQQDHTLLNVFIWGICLVVNAVLWINKEQKEKPYLTQVSLDYESSPTVNLELEKKKNTEEAFDFFGKAHIEKEK